jgi:hypothetical protein
MDYVSDIREFFLYVEATTPSRVEVLAALPNSKEVNNKSWLVYFDGEAGLAVLLQTLLDAGFAFEGGPAGWPAAAVANLLQEKGMLRGQIIEIVWYGPGQPVVRPSTHE